MFTKFIAIRFLRCCRLPPFVYSFFPSCKVPIRQTEGALEKGYVSFFLTFSILWVLLSATLFYSSFGYIKVVSQISQLQHAC